MKSPPRGQGSQVTLRVTRWNLRALAQAGGGMQGTSFPKRFPKGEAASPGTALYLPVMDNPPAPIPLI